MELRLLTKKRSRKKIEAKQEIAPEQKMALHALQKQKQALDMKEWLAAAAFVGIASLLRVMMQAFPNVEPLTFFALLSGWLFGSKKGALVGISSLYLSNFLVLGGQGPWTIFQIIGYGLAGFLGGMLRKKSSVWEVLAITLIATISLQLIFNLGWSLMIGINFLVAMITGLVFSVIHVVSNLAFATLLPKARKLVYEKFKFNERELCNALIAELNSRMPAKQHSKQLKQPA